MTDSQKDILRSFDRECSWLTNSNQTLPEVPTFQVFTNKTTPNCEKIVTGSVSPQTESQIGNAHLSVNSLLPSSLLRTDVSSTLETESTVTKSEALSNQYPKNEIKKDVLSLKDTNKFNNSAEETENDHSFKSERIGISKNCFFQVRCRSKSETKLSSVNEFQNFDAQKTKLPYKLTPWWTRIDTLSPNEKRQVLRTHSFGTIAKTEDPELCCLPVNSNNPTPPCLIMLFGCPQVGKSTTINTFKKAFHGDTNYVEYAPVGDGISGYKTQSVQFYKLGKMQLGDSRGIVNDLEEIKEICLGERTGRIYRMNETVPVIELRQAKEYNYSHIHLPVVVLSASATPEEYATTTKIIETLRTIGYERIYMILTKVDLNKEKRKEIMSRGFAGISPQCIFPLCNLEGYGVGDDEKLSILLKLLVAAELEGFPKRKKINYLSALKHKLGIVLVKMNQIVDLSITLVLLLFCLLVILTGWLIISRTKLSHY